MGKRGGAKRPSNPHAGSHKHLSLREEKIGKKQTNPTNVKSKLKLEHLHNLAIWAGQASVPSLAAVFGHRLATTNEALGLLPDPSFFSCQRCETILQPGFNCKIRIEKNQVKARNRRKKQKVAAQNNVVYKCHFCSYRNLKRGTPKGHMKEICPPKNKSVTKPTHCKSTPQKPTVLEIERIISKDEVIKVDEIILPAIVGNAPTSDHPVTPVVRTKITLEGTKRKRNKSGSKRPTDSDSYSATIAGKTVSASSKRRRKSWTSLREIAQRSEHDDSQSITNSTIPFSLPHL